MNFELSKKLKDAGFSLRQGDIETEGIRYGLPSLEEFIEACPTDIGKATFVLGSANQGKEWVACYFAAASVGSVAVSDTNSLGASMTSSSAPRFMRQALPVRGLTSLFEPGGPTSLRSAATRVARSSASPFSSCAGCRKPWRPC
jgi:hypothetical protein